MKKLILGLLFLGVIFSACFANSVFIKTELSLMRVNLQEALSLPKEEAYIHIYKSNKRWEDIRKYTELSFHETKRDAITSLLIEAIEAPDDNALKKQLINQLDSVINSEMMNFGSVF